jgi:rubrerythrin
MTENPSGTKVEVLIILELCRDIENQSAELYHYFEGIFSDSPIISELWKKTALEEENHSNQFVLAINLRRQGLVQSVSLDQNTAETMLYKVKSLFEEVRRNKPGIADSLRLAIELEEELSEYHLSTMALFQEESHRKLFEAMMKNDHDHVVDLKKTYQNFMVNQE